MDVNYCTYKLSHHFGRAAAIASMRQMGVGHSLMQDIFPQTSPPDNSPYGRFSHQFLSAYSRTFPIGTVENHGNTEITKSMIFVECRESRDVIMPKCRVLPCFCQNAVVLRFLQEYFVFNHKKLKFIV